MSNLQFTKEPGYVSYLDIDPGIALDPRQMLEKFHDLPVGEQIELMRCMGQLVSKVERCLAFHPQS
jgi:hypothetical protein